MTNTDKGFFPVRKSSSLLSSSSRAERGPSSAKALHRVSPSSPGTGTLLLLLSLEPGKDKHNQAQVQPYKNIMPQATFVILSFQKSSKRDNSTKLTEIRAVPSGYQMLLRLQQELLVSLPGVVLISNN